MQRPQALVDQRRNARARRADQAAIGVVHQPQLHPRRAVGDGDQVRAVGRHPQIRPAAEARMRRSEHEAAAIDELPDPLVAAVVGAQRHGRRLHGDGRGLRLPSGAEREQQHERGERAADWVQER
jgi:hypothetical protein